MIQEKPEKNSSALKRDTAHTTPNYEDLAMKTAMQYFGETILPQLGIKQPIRTIMPTESVHLELKQMYEDFNYEMSNGSCAHFEFQSKNEGLIGLKRFRTYEALMSQIYGMPVTTYVIYSGNIRHPMTQFTEGVNTYRIIPITLKEKDADALIQKVQKGEATLIKEEFISLLLTPLMSGTISVKERIKVSYEALQRETTLLDKTEKQKMQAILYAFASKLLTSKELNEIKEVLTMTELGRMLREDGKAEGKAEVARNMLQEGIERALIQKITGLSTEQLKKVEENLRLTPQL